MILRNIRRVSAVWHYIPEDNMAYNMAARDVLSDSLSEQFSYNQAYYYSYRCYNCVTLESQLKEVLLELSLSQFIIKLLYR
jgi:hypothetical protein